MLTLNDGRAELWQWDTGRTLTVDADCSQVHFSNKVFGRSIDVDVVDGVAIIPDVLLQTDKDLNVWAFVGTAENGYTKISKTLKVNQRNKPADYVFTPPEQTTLAELVEQIGNLDELTTKAKDNLVAAINEAAKTGSGEGGTTDHSKLTNRNAENQHPMSAITGLVGALNGKVSVADIIDDLTTNAANKPLSAAQGVELKALIDAISIPKKLPNPHALTFTGAVTGSYDGSAEKTINIPSGGGEEREFALLGEIDVSAIGGGHIELTELDNYSEFYATWDTVVNDSSIASGYNLKINDETIANHAIIISKSGTSANYGWMSARYNGLVWEFNRSNGAISKYNVTLSNSNAMLPYNHILSVGKAKKFSLQAPEQSQYRAVSGTIKIYGR